MQYFECVGDSVCIIVFDLEFIGPVQNIVACKIWEMAFLCPVTKEKFKVVIDPDPSATTFPDPPSEEFFKLTRSFLKKNKAMRFPCAFQLCQTWVEKQLRKTQKSVAMFISHNTFKSDKPLLETECRRASIVPPLHWYFFDSLHYLRKHSRCKMLKKFSLGNIAEHVLKKPIANRHRAMADADACASVLNIVTCSKWNLNGPLYPFGMTSLRCVRWVGEKAEQLLWLNNIHSKEELELLIQKQLTESVWSGENPQQKMLQWVSTLFQSMPRDNVVNLSNEFLHLVYQTHGVEVR